MEQQEAMKVDVEYFAIGDTVRSTSEESDGTMAEELSMTEGQYDCRAMARELARRSRTSI